MRIAVVHARHEDASKIMATPCSFSSFSVIRPESVEDGCDVVSKCGNDLNYELHLLPCSSYAAKLVCHVHECVMLEILWLIRSSIAQQIRVETP